MDKTLKELTENPSLAEFMKNVSKLSPERQRLLLKFMKKFKEAE